VGIDWRGTGLRDCVTGVAADRSNQLEAAAAGERPAPIDQDRLPTRAGAYQQARADFEVSHGRGRGAPLDSRGQLPDDIALPEVALPEVALPEVALPDQVEVPEAEADQSGAEADEAAVDYGPAGDAPGEARLEARVDATDLPKPGRPATMVRHPVGPTVPRSRASRAGLPASRPRRSSWATAA
jgi:hypothetical protein